MIKKLFILFLLLVACKDNGPTQLPSLAIEGRVNVSTRDAVLINTPNSYLILQGQGRKGVIVYNTGNPNIPFKAFDLGCPYISPNNCVKPMTVNSSGDLSCEGCAEDDITFNHFKTSVTIEESGNEKTYYLVEYRANLQGNEIRISNFTR